MHFKKGSVVVNTDSLHIRPRLLDGCRKEQLMQIAGHYAIVLDDKQRKCEIKCIILTVLWERSVFGKGEPLSDMVSLSVPMSVSGSELTFEQRRELAAC